MPHHDIHTGFTTQVFRQLFGEKDVAMLPAGATERHHQILEPSTLISCHAGINQRHHAGEKLMDTLLLVEIFDYGRILAGETLETFFPSRVGQTPSVKNES